MFFCSLYLKAEYSDVVMKEAKKEAARLKNEGWKSVDNIHSLAEQIVWSWTLNEEFDDNGDHKYILVKGYGTGSTLNEAEQNAIDFAKLILFNEMTNSLAVDGRIVKEAGYDIQYSSTTQLMGETIYSIPSENEEVIFYWDAIRRTCFTLPHIKHAQLEMEMYRRIDDKYEVAVYMSCRKEGHCTKIGNLYYYLDFDDKKAEVTFHFDDIDLQNIVIPPIVSYKGTSYEVTGVCENAFYGHNIVEVRYPTWIDMANVRVPSTTQLIPYNPQPPLLALKNETLLFSDASKNNCIDAEENSYVSFQVMNKGKGDAESCEVTIKMQGATKGIQAFTTSLPTIAAGQTCNVKIPIVSNVNTQDGKVTFTIEVVEPSGWGIAPFDLTVATKAYEPPFIQVVDYNVASNSGKINKMEPFTLTFNVQNTKYGNAENVKVKINLPKDIYLMDGITEYYYPSIKSSNVEKINLTLAANNNYPSEQIPISISIEEKYGKYSENKEIYLPINESIRNNVIFSEKNAKPKEIQLAMMSSDVDRDIPVSLEQNENTFVLIIANEHYQSVASVPYALNDGNIFREYCIKTLGIPDKQIKYVPNATGNQIKVQINWLQNICEVFDDAQIIFYYAGHGIPDESSRTAYLLPVDGIGTDVSTGYKLDDLYAVLGRIPAENVTVFMDACFSGSKREEGMLASARGVAIKARSGMPQGNMVVFSAAQGDETAYPNNEEKHGMFTYYLLKKLQETAGDVTLHELGDYITKNVSQQSILLNGKSQTPCVTPSASLDASWREWKLK